MRVLAFEESAVHYTRALEVLDRFGPKDPGTRCDVLVALAGAEARAGVHDHADECLTQAAELALRMADGVRLTVVGLSSATPSYFGTVLPSEERARLLTEALTLLPPQDGPIRAMALARLSQVQVAEPGTSAQQSVRQSLALNSQAVAMARRLGDRDVLGLALGARMQSLWGSAPQRERLATSIELEEIALASGDELLLRQAHLWHIRELLATGAIDAVHRIMARHEQRSRGPGDPLDRSYEHNLNALLALLAGDLGTAEQLAEWGLESLHHFEAMANGIYGSLLWWPWWQQGALAAPDHRLRQVLARAGRRTRASAPSWRSCTARPGRPPWPSSASERSTTKAGPIRRPTSPKAS